MTDQQMIQPHNSFTELEQLTFLIVKDSSSVPGSLTIHICCENPAN